MKTKLLFHSPLDSPDTDEDYEEMGDESEMVTFYANECSSISS